MANANNERDHERSGGVIHKAATLEKQAVTDAELRLINKYTQEPLTAEDVFTFKTVLCDNEIDRHYEHFTKKALQDMQRLFLGKTVIKDHRAQADNQVARIYHTELVETEKKLKDGEPYTQLVAHCYMLNSEKNADLIAEIKGGIKKEGSIGFRVGSAICSICGTDNAKTYCPHWAGRSYAKEGGPQLCTFTLASVTDAYEYSLVAVPAQRNAGICKSYNGEDSYAPAEEPQQNPPAPEDGAKDKEKELALRARLASAKAQNFKEE